MQLTQTIRYLEDRLKTDFNHAKLIESLEKLSALKTGIEARNAFTQRLLLNFSSDLSLLINQYRAANSPRVLWISPR